MFRYQQRVLVLRAPPAIRRHRGPPVWSVRRHTCAFVDHWFDRERHPASHRSDCLVSRVMGHVRCAVEQGADPVPTKILHDTVRRIKRARSLRNHATNVTEASGRSTKRDRLF